MSKLQTFEIKISDTQRQQFQEDGTVVIPDVLSIFGTEEALQQTSHLAYFRRPVHLLSKLGQASKLHNRDLVDNTAIGDVLEIVQRLGQELDLDFDAQPRHYFPVETLELNAGHEYWYTLGRTSISAVVGLQGELQFTSGKGQTSVVPEGAVLISQNPQVLPYRAVAGPRDYAVGLVIPGEDIY